MNYQYPDYVNTSLITINKQNIGNRTLRFSLNIPIRSSPITKNAAIVMMNPSKATESISDKTVNRVIRMVHRFFDDVTDITITNLYPIYETHSELISLDTNSNQRNMKSISTAIELSDIVILGWGRPHRKTAQQLIDIKYHHNSLYVIDKVKQFHKPAFKVGELRDNLYPRHLGYVKNTALITALDLEYLANRLTIKIA